MPTLTTNKARDTKRELRWMDPLNGVRENRLRAGIMATSPRPTGKIVGKYPPTNIPALCRGLPTAAPHRPSGLRSCRETYGPALCPTLDEALQWARGKTILILDQKDVPVAVRVQKIEEHKAEAHAMLIVYSFQEAQACHALNPNIMMEVMVSTRVQFDQFEKTGVPWRNVVAFVGHLPSPDPKVCELIHGRGATCIVGSSRHLDRRFLSGEVTDLQVLKSGYRVLLQQGADLIETDIPAQLGPLLFASTRAPSSKQRYFCIP